MTGYRVFRKYTCCPTVVPVNVLGPWPDGQGGLEAIDATVGDAADFTYWVHGIVGRSTLTAPSPVSTLHVLYPPPPPTNLRAKVMGTTLLPMWGPLASLGTALGSNVTWTWDPLPLAYSYEATYEIMGGMPGIGPVFERFSVSTIGNPPQLGPITRPVPQSQKVQFCVAVGPPNPGQPLGIPPFSTCLVTQVP